MTKKHFTPNDIKPIVGPGNFQDVNQYIVETGLRLPSFREVVRIVYTAYKNHKIKYFSDLIDSFGRDGFWTSTAALYTDNGVFIHDHPQRSRKGHLKASDLINKLKKERNGNYFPYSSFQGDYIETSRLAKHNFILALVGKDGAEMLKFIAEKHDRERGSRHSTYLFTLDELPEIFDKEPQARSITFDILKTDVGGNAGPHIRALIENSDCTYGTGLDERLAYGVGIEK